MLSFNCETDGRAGTRGREKREKLIFQSIQVLSARCSIAWIDMWKDWQANWLAFACMWIYFPTKCVDLKLFHEARSDASFLITCVAERLSDSITVREEELHDVEHVITVISFKAKQLCLNLIISALFFFRLDTKKKEKSMVLLVLQRCQISSTLLFNFADVEREHGKVFKVFPLIGETSINV